MRKGNAVIVSRQEVVTALSIMADFTDDEIRMLGFSTSAHALALKLRDAYETGRPVKVL